MKKYRTKRWPFVFYLFSGLACSVTFSKQQSPKLDIHHTTTCTAALKSKSDQQERTEGRRSNSILRYNEAYPVGPQLLLVLQ